MFTILLAMLPAVQASSVTAEPATAPAPDCRVIVHELGESCVPAEPQRIVTVDALTTLPTLVDLGVPVVGSVSIYATGTPFPDYLQGPAVDDLPIVGSMATGINLEAVAALQPDLIIGSVPTVSSDNYDDLSAIAPTVVSRYTYYEPTWLDDVRLIADTVGRSDELDVRLADLEQRQTEVAATIAERGGPFTLSRVDVFGGEPLYYRFGCAWFGPVIESVGVTQPEAQDPDSCTPGDYQSILVYPSLEGLDVLDADAIVAYQQQASGDEVGISPFDVLEDSPLWTRLEAVQNERVFVLGDAWGLGGSIPAALILLDDLETVVFAPA